MRIRIIYEHDETSVFISLLIQARSYCVNFHLCKGFTCYLNISIFKCFAITGYSILFDFNRNEKFDRDVHSMVTLEN